MAGPSQFFSHLYTMALVFFTLLLIELVILIRSVAEIVYGADESPITPTRYLEIIEEKVPTIRYRSGLRPEPTECTVCLSKFEEGEEIRKLKCKHTFHKDCLDRWLQQDYATCPLCRRMVLPEEIVTKYRQLRNQVEYDGSDEELMLLLSAVHGNSLHRLL